MTSTPTTSPDTGSRVGWSRIVLFFALAYALPWTVWLSSTAQDHGLIGFRIPTGVALWTLMVPVLLVTAVTTGRAGLRLLLARLVRWRVGPRWWAVALLGPVLLTAVSWAVGRLFTSIPVGTEMGLAAAGGYLVFGVLLFGLTEEAAWRGTALPWLETQLDPLTAALVLGVAWGCWHAPLWWVPGSSQAGWPFLGFVVFAVAESVLLAWVFGNAGGSVLVVAVMHAATDASLAWSGVLVAGDAAFWVTCAVFVVAAAVVAARTGPGLVRRRSTAPS